MPTYDYLCPKCEHRFELFHGITDDTPKRCPKCNARAKRVPSAGAGLLFKGSGFYITDYRSKNYKDRAKQDGSGGGSGGEGAKGSDAKGGESKAADSKGGSAKGGDAKGSGSKSSKPAKSE